MHKTGIQVYNTLHSAHTIEYVWMPIGIVDCFGRIAMWIASDQCNAARWKNFPLLIHLKYETYFYIFPLSMVDWKNPFGNTG